MVKNIKKLICVTILFLAFSLNSFADNSYFIDYKKVLNTSKPGSAAQLELKNKFESESKKFKKIEEDIKKEEIKIISEKKTLSAEAYKKKVETLRKKVFDLQKNKQASFKKIAKSRNDAKQKLQEILSPIIKKYMENNNIRIILDKEAVIMGDSTLEVTDQIIVILNKELPSLKIN